MKIYVPREADANESRIAIVPDIVEKLAALKADVYVDNNLGAHLNISNEAFINAGATIVENHNDIIKQAELILRVKASDDEVLQQATPNTIHVSFLNPPLEPDLVEAMCRMQLTALSMEYIPRITRAQPMDALTSQANLAGYYSVILAANRLNKVFPMMTTAAGTVLPARVFIIGVGVAGLQAIATAKRLGAKVFAYDTRLVVEEQVKSLAAVFVKADIGETGETEQGYAKELTPEQMELQRKAMCKACKDADVVITTAQIFGRKAPIIITDEIIQEMEPGTMIIDLAIDTGGNVEGALPDGEVIKHGVKIVTIKNMPGKVALDSSKLYANNIYHFIKEGWSQEQNKFIIDANDELINSTLITLNGHNQLTDKGGS